MDIISTLRSIAAAAAAATITTVAVPAGMALLLGCAAQAGAGPASARKGPVVRLSRGRFAPERLGEVTRLIEASRAPLVPAIRGLRGLAYYHAAVDPRTSTVVNVSIWETTEDAGQMATLGAMLAQRPVFEAAGVEFEAIAGYEPIWNISPRAGAVSAAGCIDPSGAGAAAGEKRPVVRISRGHFARERLDEVRRLIASSATPLVPAIRPLRGLLYYHAGVDPGTSTVINLSVWESLEAAAQMSELPAMRAQRPVLEAAGVQFEPIASYEPSWTIERACPGDRR